PAWRHEAGVRGRDRLQPPYNTTVLVRGVAAGCVAGCNRHGHGWSYECSARSQCAAGGMCVDRHCACVDPEGPSGYRFRTHSGPQAGSCWVGDAGADADSNAGCPSSYLVCDGFETEILDARWFSYGQVTRDVSIMHRGNASLHVHTDGLAAATDASAWIWE